MADDPTPNDPASEDPTPDPAPEPEPEPFDADRAKAKIAKANSEAANLRKRLKELEPLALKAKELEDASKSESEKLTERLTAAEKRAQEAELRALRVEVAAEHGLTPAQARRLVGTTKEELDADAAELLETFGSRKPGAPSSRPRERLAGGTDPNDEPQETNPEKLAAMVSRGY